MRVHVFLTISEGKEMGYRKDSLNSRAGVLFQNNNVAFVACDPVRPSPAAPGVHSLGYKAHLPCEQTGAVKPKRDTPLFGCPSFFTAFKDKSTSWEGPSLHLPGCVASPLPSSLSSPHSLYK